MGILNLALLVVTILSWLTLKSQSGTMKSLKAKEELPSKMPELSMRQLTSILPAISMQPHANMHSLSVGSVVLWVYLNLSPWPITDLHIVDRW